MCIRDRFTNTDTTSNLVVNTQALFTATDFDGLQFPAFKPCLLYTSDAADERSSVDLGGRRIIKKKNKDNIGSHHCAYT